MIAELKIIYNAAPKPDEIKKALRFFEARTGLDRDTISRAHQALECDGSKSLAYLFRSCSLSAAVAQKLINGKSVLWHLRKNREHAIDKVRLRVDWFLSKSPEERRAVPPLDPALV